MILGIETSCDETAAALVTTDGPVALLGRRLAGRAARPLRRRRPRGRLTAPPRACRPRRARGPARGGRRLEEVERIGVTRGPGLIGALLVGLSAAKAIAWSRGIPLVPVDHLHGHVASLYLGPEPLEPPFTCLLASGGHTLLLAVRDHGSFERLGTTLDDAAGEAFDKGARLLGLGYPGGAAIDALAREGDPEAYRVPRRARARARLLLLGAEDGPALRRARARRARARGAARRSRRLVPAGDRDGADPAPARGGGTDRPRSDRRRRRRGGELASSAPRSPTPSSRRSHSAPTTRP